MPNSPDPKKVTFSAAEEAWLAKVELTHKVPLSAEQYRVVRAFLKSGGEASA